MMKNKMMMSAFALLGALVMTLTFASCDEDDHNTPVANVEFSNIEIAGEDAKVVVGEDIHIECDIKSAAKISLIEVTIQQQNGSGRIHQKWTDAKYVGVLNTKFHEHLEVSDKFAAGVYRFVLTVTDVNGAKKSIEKDLTFVVPDPNAPKIELITPGDAVMSGVAGGKLLVKANITTVNPIEEVEVEFHGKEEFPVKITDLNGKKGAVTLNKEIMIPAACTPGKYHFHLIVTDSKGLKKVAELEGFTIKAAK